MDHNVVLGLSPYGPAAGVGKDGFNEIDTEFSYWNDEIGNVNMDWGVYPATAAAKHFETDFLISLSGGTETTTRMTWSSASVVGTVMSGFQAIGSTAGELKTYTYAPSNFQDAIPQQPLPVLLNLWCYKAVPADGNDVEVVLQDFQFVPEGQPIPDAGVADDAGSGNAEDAGAAQDAGTGNAKDAGGSPSEDASAPPAPGGGQDDAAAPSGGSSGTGDAGGADASAGSGSGGGAGASGGCGVSGARAHGPGGAMKGLLALVTILALSRRRRMRARPLHFASR
jgi:MYXO-CTERM domain-containing protein